MQNTKQSGARNNRLQGTPNRAIARPVAPEAERYGRRNKMKVLLISTVLGFSLLGCKKSEEKQSQQTLNENIHETDIHKSVENEIVESESEKLLKEVSNSMPKTDFYDSEIHSIREKWQKVFESKDFVSCKCVVEEYVNDFPVFCGGTSDVLVDCIAPMFEVSLLTPRLFEKRTVKVVFSDRDDDSKIDLRKSHIGDNCRIRLPREFLRSEFESISTDFDINFELLTK